MKNKHFFRRPRHHYVRHDPLIDMPEFDGRVFKLIGQKYNEVIREGAWSDMPHARRSRNREEEAKRRDKWRKAERKFKLSQLEENLEV